MKLGHIGISVSCLKRSLSFYKQYFGFKCVKKYVHKEAGFIIALLKKGNIALELFAFDKYRPLPNYRKTLKNDLRTVGTKHFSINTPDIKAAYRKFKKNRDILATGLESFDDGNKYFFIKDPDGILIEIMEA